MKLVGLCFLFFAASASLANPIDSGSTLDHFLDFSQGLAFGLGEKIGLEQFLTCGSEGWQGLTDAWDSVSHLISGTTFFDTLIVVEKFGSSLQHISKGTFECSQAINNGNFQDLYDIEQLIVNHPEVFLNNLFRKLLTEGNILLNDLKLFASNWSDGVYFSAGDHLGKALSLILD